MENWCSVEVMALAMKLWDLVVYEELCGDVGAVVEFDILA